VGTGTGVLSALLDVATHPFVQRTLWAAAAAAAAIAIGSWSRRRRATIRTVGIVAFATVFVTQPALANFTGTNAPVATVNAANIAASTGLSCNWTSGTAVQLSWTASGTTWADNNYINRKVNSGSYSEVGSTGARTTVNFSDTGLTPETNSYTWTVKAGKDNWRGDATSELSSSSCSGGTATVTTIAYPASTARVQDPDGVRYDASGNLYIADTGNHVIRKVDTTGAISTVAGTAGSSGSSGDGNSATSATLNAPEAVVVAPNGDIIIADTQNNKVRYVDVDDLVSPGNPRIKLLAGTGSTGSSGDGNDASLARLNKPAGLAIDSDGDLFSRTARTRVSAGTRPEWTGSGRPTTSPSTRTVQASRTPKVSTSKRCREPSTSTSRTDRTTTSCAGR
jgi:hypothetical protein